MTEWQAGIVAFREGRLREAVDRLRQAVNDHEHAVSQGARYQAYAYLGAALYALGQAAEAVPAFEAALRLNPTPFPPADLMLNLANSYLATGRRSQAQQTLEAVLRIAPGQMDAQMLLARLSSQPPGEDVIGAILGESPMIVKRFLQTLNFSTVAQGYAPEQVRAAISNVQYYIDFLMAQLTQREQEIGMHAAEIDRLRQSEEMLIQSLLEARQQAGATLADGTSGPLAHECAPKDAANFENMNLTPLEKLFQQKH